MPGYWNFGGTASSCGLGVRVNFFSVTVLISSLFCLINKENKRKFAEPTACELLLWRQMQAKPASPSTTLAGPNRQSNFQESSEIANLDYVACAQRGFPFHLAYVCSASRRSETVRVA